MTAIMTNPISFKDRSGYDRWYRRVGENIEFNGNETPLGIDILHETLTTVNQGLHSEYHTARVIGWESSVQIIQCCLENERVEVKVKGSNIKFDTHNMCTITNKIKITIPISGKYRVYYEKEFSKGDVIKFKKTDKLTIGRKV